MTSLPHTPASQAPTAPLLQVTDLVREYPLPARPPAGPPAKVQALKGVIFTLHSGRCLGVVGDSGSRQIHPGAHRDGAGPPTSGRVRLLGRDLHQLPAAALREARRDFQMVFQDPYGSLDPRQHRGADRERAAASPGQHPAGISPAREALRRSPRWACTRKMDRLPPQFFWRPAPAHCHCPGPHHPAPAHRGR